MKQAGKLTALEQRFLEVTSLSADSDFKEIAETLKTPVHRVQYAFRSLIERKIIRGRVAFIDYSRLGRISASCVLTVGNYSKKVREQLKAAIVKDKAISWSSEIIGDGHVVVQMFTNNLDEVRNVIGSLQSKITLSSMDHKIAIRLRHYAIENRLYSLTSDREKTRSVLYATSGSSSAEVNIDELDRQCLRELSHPNVHSVDSLSRSLGESKATIHRRVQALIEKKVIQGYHWSLDQNLLGLMRFRLLLKSQRLDAPFEKHLEKIVRQHPNVTNFAVCLGDWDYELSVEIRQGENIHETVGEIVESIGYEGLSYSLYQNVEYLKYSFSGV
jgi:DNA-binding Lrp family transcriptional regulator